MATGQIERQKGFRVDIGLYTDSLTEHPFEEALDLAAGSGVRSIEIATGGQSSAPHLDLDELLASAAARSTFLAAFASRGLRIAALNCSAWPMHPVVGDAHSALIDKTLQLASELEITKIVSMAGCPGDGPGATTINWPWYPWPDDAVELGRRNWDTGLELWADEGAPGPGLRGDPDRVRAPPAPPRVQRPHRARVPGRDWRPSSGSTSIPATCSGSRWTRSRWSGRSGRRSSTCI